MDCISGLGTENPEGLSLLEEFRQSQDSMTLEQLQELYTSTFDLLPDCSLYLGYQLFGDDWRRSTFLADLAGRYRGCGLPVGKELPDHLCLILRYLAKEEEGSDQIPLIHECLVPALTRVLKAIDKKANPYGLALEALLVWLKTLAGDRRAISETLDVRR
jgi:nitrate reductase delta subunit